MKHISLFSGIGGFDLAAEWMGWENIAHCEWNPFGQMNLKYYWQNSISYDDITKTDFTIYRGNIDILTGGFPCQPYSIAGKRKGNEDERHLWPEMLRAIREIQPRWVVGENVRGIINWDAGLVFNEVQSDLEAEGYKILPFLLPAAGVNAPHERYRTWFVAYSDSIGSGRRSITCDRQNCNKAIGPNVFSETKGSCLQWPVTNTCIIDGRNICGHETCFRGKTKEQPIDSNISNNESSANTTGARQPSEEHRQTESGWITKESVPDDWQNFPTQSPVRNGNDGFPTESLRQRIREDSMGNLSEKEIDKIISKAVTSWTNESIKAGGNAIVPQVVYQIFKAIEQYESYEPTK
jgi:DNA (cytosine-5)-methyltransferase 1